VGERKKGAVVGEAEVRLLVQVRVVHEEPDHAAVQRLDREGVGAGVGALEYFLAVDQKTCAQVLTERAAGPAPDESDVPGIALDLVRARSGDERIAGRREQTDETVTALERREVLVADEGAVRGEAFDFVGDAALQLDWTEMAVRIGRRNVDRSA